MNYVKLIKADQLEYFDERAGILEYDAGMSRIDAERTAYIELVRASRESKQKSKEIELFEEK